MEVKELGHLVLYVRDVERSAAFYRDVLGWRQIGGRGVDDGSTLALPFAAFSSPNGRTHHELLLIELSPPTEEAARGRLSPPTEEAARGRLSPPTEEAARERRGADAAPVPAGRRIGLYHFGLKVGDSDDELRAALARVQEAGVRVVGASDHTVTHSLYVEDPDGNELELYIDVPGVDWRSDPSLVMAPVKPLQL